MLVLARDASGPELLGRLFFYGILIGVVALLVWGIVYFVRRASAYTYPDAVLEQVKSDLTARWGSAAAEYAAGAEGLGRMRVCSHPDKAGGKTATLVLEQHGRPVPASEVVGAGEGSSPEEQDTARRWLDYSLETGIEHVDGELAAAGHPKLQSVCLEIPDFPSPASSSMLRVLKPGDACPLTGWHGR